MAQEGTVRLNLLMIFNPHAHAGRAARLRTQIRSALEVFARVDVLQTAAAGDALTMAADADLDAYDGLLAAGGDGTLFEVLNGLYHQQPEQRIPLGLIPVGTGNAFARDLGLMPGDWHKAVDIVRSAQRKRVDVGRVETPEESYYFLNIIGAGLPVDAMITAEKLKFVGQSAYTLATFYHAMRLRSHRFMIEIDGERMEQESMFVEVSNTRYTGTSFLIAPAAELDDGQLDVTLVKKLSRPRLLRLFPTIYKGNHVHYEEVLTRRASVIRIDAPAGMVLAPDGEFRGQTPATIQCLHRDLEIFAANKGSEYARGQSKVPE